MRKTLIAFAAILFISAIASCSSDSKKTTTPTGNNNSSTSSSSSSGDGDAKTTLGSAEFCRELNGAFQIVSEQRNLSGGAESVETFRRVEPPQELSGVWDDFIDALDEISKLDENDEQGKAQVAVRHVQSLGQVSLYIGQSCAALGQSELSDLSDLSS